MRCFFACLFIILLCSNCKTESQQSTKKALVVKEIPTPCQYGGEGNLFTNENGQIFFSWVEHLNDTLDALQFSKLQNGQWTTPQTIAQGSDWFVNWADFPSLVAYPDQGQTLAAHWLQKSAPGTYEYDVKIAQSKDAGKTWAPPFIPHRDNVFAEHGFVSMLPISNDRIFVTWLDGRFTKNKINDTKILSSNDHGHGHGHTGGAMTLRGATFNKNGQLFDEVELDHKVCDCCQTAAAKTEKGVIVAYRDRTDQEIRDISIVRQVDGHWTEPRTVHVDDWKTTACPVNGPALASSGKTVALAWYTASNEKPAIKYSLSFDNGANFQPAIEIECDPIGRVDIQMLNEQEAIMSWVDQSDKGAHIKVAKINADGIIGTPQIVVSTDSSRRTGFPIMTKNGDNLLMVWTAVVDSLTKVKSALLEI